MEPELLILNVPIYLLDSFFGKEHVHSDVHVLTLGLFLFFLSVGSYTHSKGIELVRKHIQAFIEKRDGGIPADKESIYLINGATEGIRVSDAGRTFTLLMRPYKM